LVFLNTLDFLLELRPAEFMDFIVKGIFSTGYNHHYLLFNHKGITRMLLLALVLFKPLLEIISFTTISLEILDNGE